MKKDSEHYKKSTASGEAGYLDRARIRELLKISIEKPVIAVTAGAGFGKTVAVSSFLQDYDAVTIWIQLSEVDNIITRVWSRFISAVKRENKELAARLEMLGVPESKVAYNKLLELITQEVSKKKYFVIFDDFHLISDKTVLRLIEKLIYEQIVGLSIVLISRTEPNINKVGLLSKGLLALITEDNLRFEKEEMLDYFTYQSFELSELAASNIYNYTEGWIFAIYLIGLSLKKGVRYEKVPISAIRQDISKLIEVEIFSAISQELQDFLIKLSLIDNLPLELLEVLSSNTPRLLDEMSKTSSFIRYDVFSNTYRIHTLLLDFLKRRQSSLKPKSIRQTYLQAAKWCAENGYAIDALVYYEKIGLYDEIIKILLTYTKRCPANTADFIIGILERAPKKLYEQKPIMHILRAKFYLNNFIIETPLTELNTLKEKYEKLPSSPENTAILGETYIILGLLGFITCFATGVHDYPQLFKKACECLPEGSVFIDNNMHLCACNYICFVHHPEKGEFKKCVDAIMEAMPSAAKAMNGCGHGYEYLALAEMAYFQRDLKNAEKYAYQAIYKSREKDQFDIENMALFYLIRLNLYTGDYSKVTSLFEQLKLQIEKYNDVFCYTINDIAEGWVYTQLGLPEKVAGWINDYKKSSDQTLQITFALDNLIRAKYFLAGKKYYELLALLEQHSNKYGLDDFLLGKIDVKILKAIALYKTDQQENALLELEAAYELSAPNGLITQFIEYGNDMRTLTQAALRSESCKIPKAWLNNIYTKSSTYAKKLARIIYEYRISNTDEEPRIKLSKRELEVLSDLCHGLTRDEIADNLDLSSNTVKNILQNIYTKLGAANSRDAIHIATSRNIVS